MNENEVPGRQPGRQPGLAGPKWTRRNFIYGSAAVAAGAALVRGGAPRSAPGALRLPRGLPVLTAAVSPLQGTSGSFSLVQVGPSAAGTTGSLDLTLSTGSTQGNLLVATILSGDATPAGAFTAPAGWRSAKAVAGPTSPSDSGRVEIWYYPGTADSLGCPQGVTSATFTSSNGSTVRGNMTEFGVPSGMIAALDCAGQASGSTGGTFSMTAPSGNVGNALGVAVAADFFGSAVSGTWTGPAGWTSLRILGGTVTDPWSSWYDLSLGAGIQAIKPSYSDTTGEQGWALAFAAFRAVAFQAIYLDGAEMITMAAVDPTGQELIMAGDVEGSWRTADFGDHWQITQDGMYMDEWRCNASVAWSETVAGEVYSCVGKIATKNDGGFLVSTDGGVTWSMRASAQTYNFLNFQANQAAAVLPSDEQDDQDRSVGHLIAQFSVGGTNYLCAATYNSGVARSVDDGASWKKIGLGSGSSTDPYGNYYLRALSLDPASSTGLYAGAWLYTGGSSGTTGGLYHTADATVASPTWSPVALPGDVPANSTVSDLKVLGGNLYVTFTEGGSQYGIYLYNPGISGGPWFSLNGGLTGPSYGIWTSLDGYVGSAGNHEILAACGSGSSRTGQTNYTNVVQIKVNPATGAVISTSDLTANATINLGKIPPDGQTWWHADSGYHNWIGGNSFGNPHVLVNPLDTSQIFVTGAGGFYSYTPSTTTWQIAVNGAPACATFDIVTDPNVASHYVICGDDFNLIDVAGDVSGFSATVTTTAPPNAADGDKRETHYAVFDPRPSITVSGTTYTSVVYVAFGNKYGLGDENANGEIFWTDSTDHTWYPTTPINGTGFLGAVGGDVPTGLYAGGSSGSGYYLVAATIGNGIWRSAIPADPTVETNWAWSPVNSTVGKSASIVQQTPIVANAAGTVLYCFDRAASTSTVATGIWRSTNAGNSWTLIWNLSSSPYNLSVADIRSGWLAVNPNPTGSGDELWVSTSGSIWKLTGANSGTVGGGITPVNMSGSSPGSFPDGSGGLAFTASSATLYAISLSGPSQASARLLSLPNGGSASQWADADPGGSIGSYVSWPGPLTLTIPAAGTQTLLLANQPNFGVYGTVSS
jgi:hypothetical protein